ncbi:hypothetical protein K9K83_00240 [Candidatus Woesearchaeota archaeon]|nr:hypothetical protein [Candidatus Woesearchaeota archaeon]
MARKKEIQNEILEKSFKEVKQYLKSMDQRTKESKLEFSLAKQEFLAELEDLASAWFTQRVKEVHAKKTRKIS